MTQATKKHFERHMVAGLLRSLGVAEETTVESSESPDVIVHLHGRLIGVEVTEIQKSEEERQLRAPKDDILQRARQLYAAGGRPQLSVTISFNLDADLRSVDRVSFSDELARYMQSRSGEADFECKVSSAVELPDNLRRYIREIRYWAEPARGVWQCVEASWVAPLTGVVLQERIDAKARRLCDYRARGLGGYWLLVCAHPLNPACRFEAGLDFDPSAIQSPFDRTFFYDCWQMYELGAAISAG